MQPCVGIQKSCQGPELLCLCSLPSILCLYLCNKGHKMAFFYVQALCSPSTRKKRKGKRYGVYFIFIKKIIAFAEAPPCRLLLTSHWPELSHMLIPNCKRVLERCLSVILDNIWVLLVKKSFC